MARHLHSKLVDYQILGRTKATGTLHHGSSVYGVGWGGVITAGGLESGFIEVEDDADIADEVVGASFLLSSTLGLDVRLPEPSRSRHYRFIEMEAHPGFNHVVRTHDGSGLVYGGVVVGDAVPPVALASGAGSIIFGVNAAPGDRISLIASGNRWYVSDGVCSVDGGISFA